MAAHCETYDRRRNDRWPRSEETLNPFEIAQAQLDEAAG